MDEVTARAIIAHIEDEHTERKLGSTHFDRVKLLKYCTALANERGGYLILGVKDDGTIVGTKAFIDKLQDLKHHIYSSTLISRRLRVEIDELELDGKRVLILTIPSRPIGEAVSYDGAYLMRSGESLVAMDFDTLAGIIDEKSPDFSAGIISGARVSDLDPAAIEKARQLWIAKSGNQALTALSHKGILQGLELASDSGHLTAAAIILMGTPAAVSKYIPNSEIIWEYRKSSATIPFQARQEFKQGFLLHVDELWQLINSRNEVAHVQEGFFIRDLRAFSEDVLREAILNTVAHRNYADQGSVYIKQSSEEITISNPGGFLPGVTPENIVTAVSKPRNRRIAEVFQKLGLVDRSGQGADKIFQQTISEGKGLPDYSASDNYSVILHINAQIQDVAFLRYIERITQEIKINLSVHDYIVLEQVRQSLHPTPGPRLEKLIDNGLIERIGRGRSSKLILSKKYYAAIGKRGEYTRRRGLDKHTNIELILKHLSLHKKGYAKELQEALPHLSRVTINRYLSQLSEAGKIRAVGNMQIAHGKNKGYWELVPVSSSQPPTDALYEEVK